MYFFALKLDNSYQIDSVSNNIEHYLDFEPIDVVDNELAIWSEEGDLYKVTQDTGGMFGKNVDPDYKNNKYSIVMVKKNDIEGLDRALKNFLIYILSSNKFNKLITNQASVENSNHNQLIKIAKQLDLINQY